MLHLLVLLLKIIGILLLVLLVLLLLTVLFVLFVPVRYRAQAEYAGKVSGKGKATWLLHLLSVRFEILENHPKYEIRIIGIPLGFFQKIGKKRKVWKQKKKGKRKKPQKPQKPKNTEPAKKPQKPRKPAQISEMVQPGLTEVAQPAGVASAQTVTTQPVKTQPAAVQPTVAQTPTARAEAVSEKKPGFWTRLKERILSLFRSVKAFVLGIRDKVLAFFEKVKGWKERVVYIRDYVSGLLQAEYTRPAVVQLFSQLKTLFRHLKPKKLSVWLHYGTGDPYTLGQHLMYLSILYGFLGEYLEVEPDWDEKVLEAKGTVKGRIRVFTLLRICIKVVTDKNIKNLWKEIKAFERS